MRVIVGLGNPGAEYEATRHNVGWWAVDRFAYDWGFGSFEREGRASLTKGQVGTDPVWLVKPATYMNRSGLALRFLWELEGFEPSEDLLVVVDDAALDVGRVRFRSQGSPGGHNGLKSVSGVLGSNQYPRLRIGVGQKPERMDLADWVLSPMPDEDEDVIVGLLPELTRAVEVWMAEGMESAMNRYNR